MARLPFDIEELLSMPYVYSQLEQARKELGKAIQSDGDKHAAGLALAIVETWQSRFEELLRSEIPDWPCLAGFRLIADFNIAPSQIPELKDMQFSNSTGVEFPPTIETWDEFRRAYMEYFSGNDLHSGKFTVVEAKQPSDRQGSVAQYLLDRLNDFRPTLGGQSGNTLWLLATINGNARGCIPYLAERLFQIKDIIEMPFLSIGPDKSEWKLLGDLEPGVMSSNSGARPPAPSGGGFVIAQNGKRMILLLKGCRVVQPGEPPPLPFDGVEYRSDGRPLGPVIAKEKGDQVWPLIPFFAHVFLEGPLLVIDILGEERLRAAMHSPSGGLAAQQVVIGGLNMVFSKDDIWLNRSGPVRAVLAGLIEQQMRCLRGCGIRVGAELSGLPDRDYFEMLKRLCREGTIVALGLNGEDELPGLISFNEDEIPVDFRDDAADKSAAMFPYITYLRARKLAQALGIRTLYVHTTSIDLVLRRHADPGSLLQAQRSAFLGKGLVIAALMKRSYPPDWMEHLPRMPFAVNPKAMVKLWNFSKQFEVRTPGSFEGIVTTGLWVNPDDDDYSLALVPVLWPSVEDTDKMPKEFNATGAGDMTFGVFFYLGGV